jgi:ATP-dependent helicase YprA (DUF1998 family)
MSEPRRYVRRSPQQWRQILDEFAASGLDRSTFCRERGLVRETLRQAERRLGSTEEQPSFVELSPDLVNDLPERRWEIELEFGDGLVLRLARR